MRIGSFIVIVLSGLLLTVVWHSQQTIRELRKEVAAYAEGNIEIEESYEQMIISADEEISHQKNHRDYLERYVEEQRAEIEESYEIIDAIPRDALILPDIGKKGLY